MSPTPRIDLDGVALVDEVQPSTVLAIFRYRTTQGLVLLMPESAEFSVDWSQLESADLDLKEGTIRIQFCDGYVAEQNWLRGATTVVGRWMDRYTMRH